MGPSIDHLIQGSLIPVSIAGYAKLRHASIHRSPTLHKSVVLDAPMASSLSHIVPNIVEAGYGGRAAAPLSIWARQAADDEQTQQKRGAIRRLVLSNEGRTKLDPSTDRSFYAFPRFVTHVDDAFLKTLTQLYRDRIPPNSEIFDLMSSWVSHLPPEIKYKRVVGHGLNAAELARNTCLHSFFVKDLNQDPLFEAGDASFDAILCTVSVQYLQKPEKVFAEIYRMLRPGGVCIVSFSNRMFYEKAIAAWREGTAVSRIQLVVQYFQCIDGFTEPEVVRGNLQSSPTKPSSPLDWLLSWFKATQKDPFYAVVAYRDFKPI